MTFSGKLGELGVQVGQVGQRAEGHDTEHWATRPGLLLAWVSWDRTIHRRLTCTSHTCNLESLSASGGPPASACIRNLSTERNRLIYMQSGSSLWECLWMCCLPLLPGVIRDWKNQFADAQTKKFNEDYRKHMADTSLSFHMRCKRQPTWSRRESVSKTCHWLMWPDTRVFKRWPGHSSALNSWPIFWNPVWCQLSSIYMHHFLLPLQSSVFRWMPGYKM